MPWSIIIIILLWTLQSPRPLPLFCPGETPSPVIYNSPPTLHLYPHRWLWVKKLNWFHFKFTATNPRRIHCAAHTLIHVHNFSALSSPFLLLNLPASPSHLTLLITLFLISLRKSKQSEYNFCTFPPPNLILYSNLYPSFPLQGMYCPFTCTFEPIPSALGHYFCNCLPPISLVAFLYWIILLA